MTGDHTMRMLLLAACAFLGLAMPVAAATVTVTSTPALQAAYAAAKTGDMIKLAPGAYGFFIDQTAHDFGAGITITSQDPAHPATVAGFNLYNAKGVTLSHMVVTWSKEQNGVFVLSGMTDLTLDHLDMNGSGSTDPPAKIVGSTGAINVLGQCTRCAFTNNLIHNTAQGIILTGERTATGFNPIAGPVTISNNEIWNVNGDGIHGAFANKTTITHNTVHDFVDPKDGSHADALQFENDASPIDDLTVTNNWFYSGASPYGFQGIFLIGYPVFGPLNNPLVENNVICSVQQHNGLYVTGSVGGSIRNNYVTAPGTMKVYVHQATNTVVSGNTSNNLDLGENTGAAITLGANPVIPGPLDCAAAATTAAAAGAGAGPRAALGPQAPVVAVSAPPTPSLAPQVADLTAKLAAANAQIATLMQQMTDTKGAQVTTQAALASVTAERDALKAAIARFIAAKTALGF